MNPDDLQFIFDEAANERILDLIKDKERLDWLTVNIDFMKWLVEETEKCPMDMLPPCLRPAIDKAMKKDLL